MDFRLLGVVELWVAGRAVDLGPGKQRGVLAALLVDAGHVVSTDTLIYRLWDDRPPPAVRSVVYTHVSRIRRMLAGAGGVGLLRRSGGYLLQVDPDQVDLHRFRRLVALARATADPRSATETYRQAFALWRDEVCTDLSGRWFDGLREDLAGERLAALADRLDLELALGHHHDLLPELRALCAAHPLDERLAGQAMLATYRSGRQAEALHRYEQIRRRLADEIGVDPGPDLRRLHHLILHTDPVLADPTGPAEPPVTGPARRVPAHLPHGVNGFTGRVRELAALDNLLTGGDRTAVLISAIAGMAGVGKTALAVHWAHQVRDRFPDGQLYVNLRGYAAVPTLQPIEALAGFLTALGVPADQVPVDLDAAAGLYRSLLADRRILVLLDNACDVEQVRPLLPGSPGCLVVVTSRDRLSGLVARDGALRLALDVLTPDEAHGLLAQLLGHDRTHAEPDAVTELIRLCGLLPLALRIAAAALTDAPHRTIASYVAELAAGNRLAMLAADGDERSGLRATFDLSYATLAPPAQRMFRLLGLVPVSDTTAAAAAALVGCPTAQARTLLDRLAGAHLLAEHTPDRYAMHDLLHAHAGELARAEPDPVAAASQLYDWYLHTVDAAARLLYPEKLRLPLDPETVPPVVEFDGHAAAAAWLDTERANLVAVVQHTAEDGPRVFAWLIADALRGYFWLRRHSVDWLVVAEAAVVAAEADGDPAAQAAAYLNVGDAHQLQGRYRQSVGPYTRALELNRRTGWLEGQSAALNNLAIAHWELGRVEEAIDSQTRSMEIKRKTGRLAAEAIGLCNLGLMYGYLGRLDEAADHHAQALALYRRLDARAGEAVELGNLGEVCHALGRFEDARDHLTRAAELNHEIGNREIESDNLRALAEVHRDAGRLDQAQQTVSAALSILTGTVDRQYRANVFNALATIECRLGRPGLAIGHHRQALPLAERDSTVHALVGLATAHAQLDQLDQAYAAAERAVSLARQIRYRVLEGQALTVRADIHRVLNRPEQAAADARLAVAIQRETGHRLGLARALVTLGRAEGQPGHRVEASALFAAVGAPEAEQITAGR